MPCQAAVRAHLAWVAEQPTEHELMARCISAIELVRRAHAATATPAAAASSFDAAPAAAGSAPPSGTPPSPPPPLNASSEASLVAALDLLRELIAPLDNAADLCGMGGVAALVGLLADAAAAERGAGAAGAAGATAGGAMTAAAVEFGKGGGPLTPAVAAAVAWTLGTAAANHGRVQLQVWRVCVLLCFTHAAFP